jgi:hypothetical protein
MVLTVSSNLSQAYSMFENLKNTILIRAYAFLNIPLIWWVRPSVIEVSDQRTILKIPLNRRTQNHLKVMYFGAMAMGAEAAVAVKAIHAIYKSKKKVDYIFKDFHADFLKRAEGDVHFICDEGIAVESLVQKAIDSGQRESQTFNSYAIVPSKDPSQKVATFAVTLSVKMRAVKKQN